MKITVPYEFTADVTPPRCRKPRPERQQGEITLTIHEVTGDEAPVAIREDFYDLGTGGRATREFRFWRNKLWTHCTFRRAVGEPHETQDAAAFQASPYPYDGRRSHHYNGYRSKQQRRLEILAWAGSVLFIDGQRWEQAGEPRYVVMTFGLGCNHGLGWGTSLSTDQHYNSNIGKTRYFRADQFELAVAAATAIAEGRGDTKALPIVETQNPTRYEVLIPAALRLRPARDHGDGDPFLNKVEGVISRTRSPFLATMFVLHEAMKEVGSKRA